MKNKGTHHILLIVLSVLYGCRGVNNSDAYITITSVHDTSSQPKNYTIQAIPDFGNHTYLNTLLNEKRDSFYLVKRDQPHRFSETGIDTVNVIKGAVTSINDTFYYNDNDTYNDVIFKNKVEFNNCTFLDTISHNNIWALIYSTFDSTVIFDHDNFVTDFDFHGCEFEKTLFINSPKVERKLLFSSCRLANGLQFNSEDEFDEDEAFNNLFFGRSKSLTFTSDLIFYNCTLAGRFDFTQCMFDTGSNLIFKRCSLPDTLDFSDTKILGAVNLLETYPSPQHTTCQINMLNTDIDKVRMRYQNFHLYFPNRMSDSIQYKDVINSTYQTLLNNFSRSGFNDSYEQLDKEYKDWQAEDDFAMRISGWWWKYGYEKWRILVWTIVILLIFSFLNVFLYERLFATYAIKQLDKTKYEYSKIPLVRGIENYWLSIMYTGFIFFKLSIDFDKIEIKKWSILFLIFLEYSVGLLCTGYLLNWVLSK